ncbi:23S rRNA (uracil(1939)-C(5))-methyltransferase RlmD [Aestuariibacter sp. AA17]|uniref:23S rRNA (Uracil(1939)-C(5))-methyltransferase RlmD n=1 Tax=Fluctibacter corallii TaxID=2984329 RepID=A0ABT3A4D9_9ALTE|nr:23S rRNA (uracil(1939)-C(5))-methyltransferase RlmD [Aestuariibacter sp. AA17]MCV2883551.1 23S rRNA (uracil(1939)-C(5))-methyltransferase RlmD [Aestuariibacter sp. AA17]
MARIFKPARGKSRQASKAKQHGEILSVSIDNVDHQGRGVARHEGAVIFVDGGLPDDQAKVKITHKKSRYWSGHIHSVEQPSPMRVTPFCEYYQQCGGCQLQHADSDGIFAAKQQAVDSLLQRVSAQQWDWSAPLQARTTGYRRKSRLAVDARNRNDIRLGFRGKSSKSVISIQHCGIMRATLSDMLPPLQALMQSLKSPSHIGHISMLEGEGEIPLQLCFRVTRQLSQQDIDTLSSFATAQNVHVVLEIKPNQFISLNREMQYIEYCPEPNIRLAVAPNDFIQVNPDINQAMVAQAIDWLALTKQDHVVDLFCGLGNFSLPIANRVASVTGVEGVTEMVQRASSNAQKNGIDNATFVQADLSEGATFSGTLFKQCSKVLLDPARDGAQNVVAHLGKTNVSHVVYVSCNPATFVRDAEILTNNGFQLQKVSLMDMFPQTSHTELMALFVRT